MKFLKNFNKTEILDKINRFFDNNRFSGVLIGFGAFIFIALFSFTDGYNFFELKLYDLRFKGKPSIEEWDKLWFLDIDENSTTALGQFPWTRDIYAKGLDVLKELGAGQVGFDVMYPDASPTQLNNDVYNNFIKKLASKVPIKQNEFSTLIRNNDDIFAQGIANNGGVIVPYTFSQDTVNIDVARRQESEEFQKARERFLEIASIPVPEGEEINFRQLEEDDIKTIVYPISPLMNSAKSFGFVNRFTDIDGTLRKVRLVQVFEGRLYFNLALAMLIDECKVKKENIIVNPGKNIVLKSAFNSKDFITEDIVIPIDKTGMIFVNWAGPGPREKSFKLIPFYSLLEYHSFADPVYEFFDNAGGIAGIQQRAELSQDIVQAGKKLKTASDDVTYRETAIELKALQNELYELKKSYMNMLEEEKVQIQEELDSNPSEELENELALIEGDIKAVELVLLAEGVRDKNLIIGLTATGTHDIGSIPIHNEYPRVGTYLNTINTIIQKQYIFKPHIIFSMLLFLVIALATGYVIQKLPARRSLLTGVLSLIFLNLIIFLLFDFANIWVEQLGSNLALLVPGLSIISIKLISEEKQKKFITGAFSRYIAPDVIDQILENPESLELGGENRPITIFFSDVAGFSGISEKLTPPELVALLNEYLSEMTDIIISHGGTIDKYEGDAIMAFYGAPQSYPDHELRACLAAIDMKTRLGEMQEHWRATGQHELYVRMGMNTGDAVVGNMGSRMRMDYTAMGDSVNLASRLEGANKFYSTTAMISQFTYEAVKDQVETRKLDTIRVVGKSEAIVIYELLSRKNDLPQKIYDLVETYNQGLELFTSRQWKKAHKAFEDALKIVPGDGPSKTYIARCEDFMKNPPTQKWDGVFSLTSK